MNSTIKNVEITPEIALELLTQTERDYQRPLRPSHVSFLTKEIKAGRFLSNTITICQNGSGKKYLVNGQHTLNAIFESGMTVCLPVQTYKIENENDIAFVYSTIDKQRKRTRADTFRAYGLEDEFEMDYTPLNKYGACAYFMVNGIKKSGGWDQIADAELIDFMREWLPYTKQYYASIEQCGSLRSSLERKEVMSIGIITSRYSPKANDFWHFAATNDGLRIGDPRRTLHDYLATSGVAGAVTSKRRIVGTSESIRYVVAAWNAFIDGRELKFLQIKNPSLPYTIKDTPYKNIS